MRLSRLLFAPLFCLALSFPGTGVRAEQPANPLRLMPNQADLLIQIDNPRKLIESYTQLDLFKQLLYLDIVREFYDSTNYRRFTQVVQHFETKLGVPWPEALDRLAGGGIALGSKVGMDKAPAVLVVQSKDEALLRKFVAATQEVLEQELARQESKERITKSSYHEIETLQLGKELNVAIVGSALMISNNNDALHLALDLHRQGDAKSMAQVASVAAARKLLAPEPLVSLWVNMDTVHKSPQAKDIFVLPRNDTNLTILFGNWLDVAGRSPFVCAGIYRDKEGFLASVRLPSGRDGMPEALSVFIPPADDQGALPLLEPKHVVYSNSFYLDFSKFWTERKKLFNEQQAKAFEDFDKNSGRFLAGNTVSKLLGQMGAHHRLVAAKQPVTDEAAKLSPSPLIQAIPAFAFVSEMREPEALGRSLETMLRGVALIAGTQLKMKLVEEKHGKYNIIGYRFSTTDKVAADTEGIRHRFSPCFVAVNNQFIASSTIDFCKELIDLVENESQAKTNVKSATFGRSQLYSEGGAEIYRGLSDFLLAQTILDRAETPEAAKKQVQSLIEFLKQLGVLRIEQTYLAKESRYEFRLKLNK